jgi:F0F1-type ATP synthase assembly protein I
VKDRRAAGVMAQLSWVLAFSVLLPLGLGILLDRLLHATPLFLLVGAMIGVLAGTVGAVRVSARAIEGVERRHADSIDNTPRKEDKA